MQVVHPAVAAFAAWTEGSSNAPARSRLQQRALTLAALTLAALTLAASALVTHPALRAPSSWKIRG